MSARSLALTCDLAERETPTSFAARLAIRNMSGGAQEFCRDMGLDWKALIRGETTEIFRLAGLARADETALQRNAFKILSHGHLRIGCEEVRAASLLRAQIRVCPMCLVERVAAHGFVGAYRPTDWQFLSIRTCACHGVPLTRLPSEPAPMQNYDFGFIIQKNWAKIEETAPKVPRWKPSNLEIYLRKRLSGWKGRCWIDQMPLSIIAKAAEVLGARVEFGPSITANALGEEQWHHAGNCGFDILYNGHDCLQRALFDLMGKFEGGSGFHNRDLGIFYIWLNRARRYPGIETIKNLVLDHIVQNYPLEPGVMVLGQRIEQPRCVTWTNARRRLGVRRERMTYLVGDLTGSANTPGNKPMNLTSLQIDALQAKMNDMISITDAEKILGCEYELVVRFVESGMLSRWGEASTRPYLSREEVEALVAPVRTLDGASDTLNLKPMERICVITKARAHEIYKCFLEGKLKTAFRDTTKAGLRSLLLDPVEVKFSLPVQDKTDPTMLDVAARLKTNAKTLRYLAQSGELRIYRARDATTRGLQSYVGEDELRQFQAKFMTIGEVGDFFDMHSGPLSVKLDALGLRPRRVPARVSRIYQRVDIERLSTSYWRKL
ncbi:TniQ family protein [Brucella anthropi]|uniref:TniQ family protein n=1 Tax=Brucella anthropi TaxID=529 RepID=UPI002165C4FE|nr:TniQ family protein [Brucella anthropi]UVV67833.1 TniQ family protein [Brucella anthropi]